MHKGQYNHYKIISGELSDVSNTVRDHLDGGWVLIGGISVTYDESMGHVYAQAMAA